MLIASGFAPEDQEVERAVDDHRSHISRWYYECSPQMHAGLGQMYAIDRRFATNIDEAGEGLADYMSAAIAALYAGQSTDSR